MPTTMITNAVTVEVLLDAMADTGLLRRYVPFDVAEPTLRAAAERVAVERPGVAVHGIVGDVRRHLRSIPDGGRRPVAFLGGTIGNLHADWQEFMADGGYRRPPAGRGARLPTEAEWETVAPRPRDDPADETGGGWYGAAWQWTASPYVAYPGFRPSAGAVGEYNGKFMVNQQVLRGSSLATPPGHARLTYRNSSRRRPLAVHGPAPRPWTGDLGTQARNGFHCAQFSCAPLICRGPATRVRGGGMHRRSPV